MPARSARHERFYEQRRRVRTASAEQVRQPINARGLGPWRRYEAYLGPMLAELTAAGLDRPPTGSAGCAGPSPESRSGQALSR